MLTAYGNIVAGVQSIKSGAFDYLTKGNDNDRIIPLLDRAVKKQRLQNRIAQLEKRIEKKFTFESIIRNKLEATMTDFSDHHESHRNR